METIDSNNRLLKAEEIVIGAVVNAPNLPYKKSHALALVAGEMALPNTEWIQAGNTLFIAHHGVGPNEKKMVGRAFNMDTGWNFIANIRKYIKHLQNKGITHYTTQFTGDGYLPVFQKLQKEAKAAGDTQIAIGRMQDKNEYVVYVKLGKNPIG